MRPFLILLLLAVPSMAQDANTTLPPEFFTAHQIAEGASRSFAELEAKAEALEQENAKLVNELAKYRSQQPTPGNCQCCKCDGCECGKVEALVTKLTMVSMPGCPACDQWWANDRPRYASVGWTVDRVSESPKRGKLYPYWRLCVGDSCTEIAFCPLSQLDAKVQAILDKRRK